MRIVPTTSGVFSNMHWLAELCDRRGERLCQRAGAALWQQTLSERALL